MIKKASSSAAQHKRLHAKTDYLIAKCKKAHNIDEDLMKSCLTEGAKIMSGNESATKLNQISMSGNIVERRIEDMSSDIWAQILHGIKSSAFPIALQLDESTGIACIY